LQVIQNILLLDYPDYLDFQNIQQQDFLELVELLH
jgi:hypothetical protein